MTNSIRSEKINVQLVAESLKAFGIKNLIFSPGSRNGALMLQFVNDPSFCCYSIVDERSAAFVALGIAQKTKVPSLICCTSGSAVANYYPAITEAFYHNIPLIVLTADRPSHFTDIFDGQTIRQENLFKKHTYFNTQLLEDDSTASIQENFLKIKSAVKSAIHQNGPVHINMPLDEPLYKITHEQKIQFDKVTLSKKAIEEVDYATLSNEFNSAKKILVLVGLHDKCSSLNNYLIELSKLPQVIVLTETTSNIHHSDFIHQIDSVLFTMRDAEQKLFTPDLLISIGQNIISKKVKQFLRKADIKKHWHINEYWQPDTYFHLTQKLEVSANSFLNELLPYVREKSSTYKSAWLSKRDLLAKEQQEYLDRIGYSDLWVYKRLIPNYPKDAVIQYGNSSVIRYSQLFDHREDLSIFCNRGTSGIDGSTSTAAGYSMKTEELVICVTGDISFFYDSNALWNQYLKNNFIIILINNGGGNIFKIIPGPEDSGVLDNFFQTRHHLNAKPLADLYGFDYVNINSEEEFKAIESSIFRQTKRAKIVEINTANVDNAQILRNYFNIAKQK